MENITKEILRNGFIKTGFLEHVTSSETGENDSINQIIEKEN